MKYTKVWRINGQLVIGRDVEDAVMLYKEYCRDYDIDDNIHEVQVVFGDNNSDLAVLSVDDEPEDDLA